MQLDPWITLVVAQVSEQGITWLYNPKVLLRNGTSDEVTLEPLSGHIFWPEPDYPGRIQWLPLSAKPSGEIVETSEAQLCFLPLMTCVFIPENSKFSSCHARTRAIWR